MRYDQAIWRIVRNRRLVSIEKVIFASGMNAEND